jgi:zinc transport system substrate-binding protein
MMKKITATAALLLLVAVGIWATIHNNKTPAQTGLKITASYYPLYDFAKQVGGNKVQVTNMTPAGSEPHDFEPTAKSLAEAQQAKLFIYNGGTMEPWTDKFVQDYTGVSVRASTGIALKAGQDEEAADTAHHQQGPTTDPHFWLDPVLAQQIVTNIKEGLSKADPANAATYERNAKAYNQKLAQLDADYRTGLKTCEQRTIVIAHQSAAYVAARYNLQVEAIAGLSPETEPSAGRLAELSQIVTAKNIHYIFFESLVSPRLADTIASETGAHTLVLDPIEGLTDEAQKAGKNYLSVQRDNLGNLRRALACQ